MKIVVSGFYGLGNTGDEAILDTIVHELKDKQGHDLTVFSLRPEETAEKHGVKSVYRGWRHAFREKLRAMRQADVLVSGGGGLLQDTYPTKIIFGPLPYYLLIAFLGKLMGCKVMFFAQGVGPVNSRYGKWLMRTFANRANLITVRDQGSKDLLEKLKVRKPETIVTADIAFAYPASEDDACLTNLPGEVQGQKLVGVSIRPWFEEKKLYQELAKYLDQLIEEQGYTPVFIPMEGQHDVKASGWVVDQMEHGDECHVLGPDFTPNQYLQMMKHCQFVIGMRLHSVIFATIAGVPMIPISYDPKVEAIAKQIGVWDYGMRLEDVSLELLNEKSEAIHEDLPAVKRQVEKSREERKQVALRNVELLEEYFDQKL
ncbi:polysaccharide pyruvyl transferase CsaB [Alkalibacillus aidingensis]|uniref:polysaccharide pyruvyl transferase CsaB n=1 Tax=Alkalibacillus aidingensis TaxID=2747607 RepID=UPI0016616360|nr:polysaccharide pyruvyl transferase CsaB [Alkalibacillus aidingensis]